MMMYRDEGKREGRREGKYEVAQNMYRKGFSVEDTAGLVDEEIETVRKWFQNFLYMEKSSPETPLFNISGVWKRKIPLPDTFDLQIL